MTKEVKSDKGFFQKLKNNYRFQVIDNSTYDVRWVFQLSRLNVITALSVVFLILLAMSFAVFALTPLRFLLPGYVGVNAEEQRAITQLKMKTEQLESKLKTNTNYINNLQAILLDSFPLHQDILQEEDRILQADAELFFPEVGNLETRYRKDFELILKQGVSSSISGTGYMLSIMRKPMEGKPLADIEGAQANLKTLRIQGKGESGITSVLPGLVFAKYKVGSDMHLYVQHEEHLVSAYKFEGSSEAAIGEWVEGGQLIGVLSESGTQILLFDVFANGEAIPSGQYLKY